MTMTKKLALSAALSLAAMSAPALAQQVQPAKIIFVDADEVMGNSTAGKAAATALNQQGQALQTRMQTLQNGFATEGDNLNKAMQNKTITQAVYDQKARDLQTRVNQANAEIDNRRRQLAANQQYVLKQLSDAMTPIIQQVMTEKGASVVMDSGPAIRVAPELEVSQLVLQRLNAKVTSVSTTAPAAPAGGR
jgi:Skp family chaperone for outer membrane proteins